MDFMTDSALAAALSRVDAALGRIEAAATRPQLSSASNDAGHDDLAARHTALKSETRSIIVEMDALIAKARSGGVL